MQQEIIKLYLAFDVFLEGVVENNLNRKEYMKGWGYNMEDFYELVMSCYDECDDECDGECDGESHEEISSLLYDLERGLILAGAECIPLSFIEKIKEASAIILGRPSNVRTKALERYLNRNHKLEQGLFWSLSRHYIARCE